jgi:hypothetical protein
VKLKNKTEARTEFTVFPDVTPCSVTDRLNHETVPSASAFTAKEILPVMYGGEVEGGDWNGGQETRGRRIVDNSELHDYGRAMI